MLCTLDGCHPQKVNEMLHYIKPLWSKCQGCAISMSPLPLMKKRKE